MSDINQKVLAAFQSEHRDFLEGLRAILVELEGHSSVEGHPTLQEAYRQAHSLKGGARVCDLKPVETIGHRLETVLEGLQNGRFSLDGKTQRLIHRALDTVEDWMAALAESSEQPPEPVEVIAEIEHFVNGTSPEADSPASAPDAKNNLKDRIRKAFAREHVAYLAGMRSFLEKSDPDEDAFDEAFRQAHTLRAAARVAGLPAIEQMGQRLESLLINCRDGQLDLDDEVLAACHQVLESIEGEMAAFIPPEGEKAAPPVSRQSEPPVVEATSLPDAPTEMAHEEKPLEPLPGAARQIESARVSVAELDQLLKSSGQLLSEGLRQAQVAQELKGLSRLIEEMEREWSSVRKIAAAQIRQWSNGSELKRLGQFLEFAEKQVRDLARQARRARLMQQRSTWSLENLSHQVQRDVKQARMVPAESVFQGFRKMVRDLARDEGREVDFRAQGFEVRADRVVLQGLKDALMHILRNAITHGIELPEDRRKAGKDDTGIIRLVIEAIGNRLQICVEDDGHGLDIEWIAEVAVRRKLITPEQREQLTEDQFARLIFHPGFSTCQEVTELSGRGMGMSVVQETVSRFQGHLQIRHEPGQGTQIEISVPLAMSTHRLLLVECANDRFAIPVHNIRRLLRLQLSKIETVEGRPIVQFQGRPVPLVSLASLLSLENEELEVEGDFLPVAIVESSSTPLALGVTAFIGEWDALIQNLDSPARRMKKLSGAILLENGSVVLVLNPEELIKAHRPSRMVPRLKSIQALEKNKAPTVLIVDDSFTTRTLEKSILEAHGYRVRAAVDGVEALTELRSEMVDLVITDIEMPRMNGFTLLEKIKSDEKLSKVPVILVTSLDKREDQERGLLLGAEAYIVKRKFDHQDLLATVQQIV